MCVASDVLIIMRSPLLFMEVFYVVVLIFYNTHNPQRNKVLLQ